MGRNIPLQRFDLGLENSTEIVNNTDATDQDTRAFEYVYFSINAIGFALNALVIVVVTCRPFISSKISWTLVLNQCIPDGIGAMIGSVSWILGGYTVPENTIGDLICCLWWSNFLMWSFIQASVNNIVLFTIERYLSIVRPVVHRQFKIGFVHVGIVLSWILSLIICIGVAYEGERKGDHCQAGIIAPIPYIVQGITTLITNIGPIVLLTVLYSRMILVLKRHNLKLNNNCRNQNHSEVSRDLTVTVRVATTAYTMLFAPETFLYALSTFGVMDVPILGWLDHLYTFLVNFNFIVNPLVFVVFLRSFRRELRKLFARSSASEDATQSTRY